MTDMLEITVPRKKPTEGYALFTSADFERRRRRPRCVMLVEEALCILTHGGRIPVWTTQVRLALFCKLSPRSVQRAVNQLIKDGRIKCVRQKDSIALKFGHASGGERNH